MAFALIIIGLALISTGVQNTQSQLTAAVASDFTGAGSFWYWIAGAIAAGAIGYYSPFQGASRLFLGLIILVFLLDNTGFFAAFASAIQNPVAAPSNAGSAPSAGAAAVGALAGAIGAGAGANAADIGSSIGSFLGGGSAPSQVTVTP